MSAIQRFLKRREQHRKQGRPDKSESVKTISLSLFRGGATSESPEDDFQRKLSTLEDRITQLGITGLTKEHISYALRSQHANGDVEKAFDFLLLIADSIDGVIGGYTPRTKLLGAENRCGVTCYLDALLFAMFARLDCFEAILYKSFDDEPRRKLSIMLRLWVNMLRAGKLITTDITKYLQEALAECGWEDAANLQQQDSSEAFTFITEKLELPLLTLKMDIYHTGKEDVSDDHKFVNERLLEVAIPEPKDGEIITLEDCLESYFNNRIEVKRYLTRRNTLGSKRSLDSLSKGHTFHVEAAEIESSASSSPRGSSPLAEEVASPLSSLLRSNESIGASTADLRKGSIVRHRLFPDPDGNQSENGSLAPSQSQSLKGNYRKEVMMPAWQFFSLIPWYTDNTPTDDAQVAAHFSLKRPLLGICLKRYHVASNGATTRLGTYIDIPTEIGLPHFIQDDNMDTEGLLYGNFKLSLQAVVCHRGNSVSSGHYIAIVRGTSAEAPPAGTDLGLSDPVKYWMRFDDLAAERVTLVNIEEALKRESPYLLFYQILPIDEDAATVNLEKKPPSSASSYETQESSGTGSLRRIASLFNPSGGRTNGSMSGRPSIEISVPDNAETRMADWNLKNAKRMIHSSGDVKGTTGLDVRAEALHSPKLLPKNQREGGRPLTAWSSKPDKSYSGSRSESQAAENRISTTFARLSRHISRDKLESGRPSLDSDVSLFEEDLIEGKDEKMSYKNKDKRNGARASDRKGKMVSIGRRKSKTREKVERVERECIVM